MSNILYYSKYCKHCKSIIVTISQSPLKDKIKFVCVDDMIKQGTLPSFVKSVPLIFKQDTNTLLKGDSAIDWIASFNPPQETDSISGFDSFTSPYSGLSDEGYAGSFSTGDSYSFIGSAPESNDASLSTQDASNSSMKSQKQSVMDTAYDKMMKDRESIGQGMKRI